MFSPHTRSRNELRRQGPRESSGCRRLAECRWLFRSCYDGLLADAAIRTWALGSLLDCTGQTEASRHRAHVGLSNGLPESVSTIKSFNPDVIVAAEVAACEMAAIARRLGLHKRQS